MKTYLARRLVLISLSLAAGFLIGCKPTAAKKTQKSSPPVSVQTVRSKRGEITRSVLLPALVLPYQQAMLYAKVGGYLKTINVDKGDAVKEGDVLADIEVPEMLADIAKYKAELEVARIDYDRVRDAQKKAPDLVVPQSVDNALGKWEVAKANLERTDTLLKYAKIIAPFSGVVTRRFVDPGAFIPAATSGSAAQNAAVVTLTDYSKVRVQVAIPEPEVPLIDKGVPVKITVEELPGHNFEGTVTRYAHTLDEATKTMLAEIELANPKGELRPGMYATAKVFVERKQDALLIPVDALVVEKVKNSVFIVVDNKAQRIAVKTGFNDDANVEIVEGLKPDQPVILVGKQALADGQPVQITEAK